MDVDFTMFSLARGSFLVVYGPFVYPYTMDVDFTMFPLACAVHKLPENCHGLKGT
jgi:hypothetical protein